MEEKKYSYRYLMFIGNTLMFSLYFGVPFLSVVLLELANLYDILPNIKFRTLVLREFVLFIIITVTLIIWVSNRWKNWALSVVTEEDHGRLINKIEGKESLVIKPWHELDVYKKILRVTLVLALSVGAIVMDHYTDKKTKLLETDPSYTEAQITRVRKYVKSKKVHLMAYYTYNIGDSLFNDSTHLSTGLLISTEEKNGFDILEGDVFVMRYYTPDHTKIHKIDFEKPLRETETRYLKLASEMAETLYSNVDPNCLVDSVYAHFGTKGIALIYNHHTGYWTNDNYNHIRFKTMARKEEYKKLKEACIK